VKRKPVKDPEGDRVRMRALRYIALATQLPFLIVGGFGIGYALDRWLGTDYLRVVCLLLGVASGFIQLIRELMKDTRQGP
jgi:F0F1-type ATP synthase assembly protein I